jgi:hypothetical protein
LKDLDAASTFKRYHPNTHVFQDDAFKLLKDWVKANGDKFFTEESLEEIFEVGVEDSDDCIYTTFVRPFTHT